MFGRNGKCFAVLVAAVLLLAAGLRAETEPVPLERFQPRWKVGQSWVVQTVLRQSQARRAVDDSRTDRPVQWRFVVQGVEQRLGRPCWRVDVTCLRPGPQPLTTIWVDRQSMTLLSVRTRIRTARGWRTIRESYRSSSGQPFPAFGPQSVPPLELPLFLAGAKGQATFRYEATQALDGAKALGDIGFAFTVDQSFETADAENIPARLPEHYAKNPRAKPLVKVTLKSATDHVQQWWQAGLPWPVWSDNGVVECSLLATHAAGDDLPPGDP